MRCLGAAVLMIFLALGPAAAAGDIAAGKGLAMRYCAGCHAIVPGMASPEANAPPFASFGAEWPVSHLEEALAEGILVGHSDPPMPEIELTPDQIDDLLAYLESIAGQ